MGFLDLEILKIGSVRPGFLQNLHFYYARPRPRPGDEESGSAWDTTRPDFFQNPIFSGFLPDLHLNLDLEIKNQGPLGTRRGLILFKKNIFSIFFEFQFYCY